MVLFLSCVLILGSNFKQMKKNEEYLTYAIDEAFTGMRDDKGGPFGAVIVLDGEIVGKGCNSVTSTNDPTAHAEVVAIRDACQRLKRFHLTGAVMYASCEPCPMCLSAIYWADIKTIYYASDRVDVENIGFSDNFIYEELAMPIEERSVKMERMKLPAATKLFAEWTDKQDKIRY